MLSRRLAWVALALMLIGTAVVSVRSVRARRRHWEVTVDRLCGCAGPTERTLDAIARTAGGGLDLVAQAERRSMLDGCAEMHAALGRRSWLDDARMRPLEVPVSAQHRTDLRALSGALDRMCGSEHTAFWQRLGERIDAHSEDPPEVLRVAREHVRVREAMCMRRSTITAPPAPYTMGISEADETADRCER